MRMLPVLVAVLMFTAAGCRDTRRASRTTFSDSAGVRVATTDLRADPLSPACRVDTTPRLQIGALDGPAEYQLGRIFSATRMSDGRIAVIDLANHDIRVYDADGKFVRRLGRTGDGPGEFRFPLQITAIGGDSLFVWDKARARAIVFDADGRVLRESLFLPPMNDAPEHISIGPGRGRFIAESWVFELPNGTPRRPQRLYLLRYGVDGRQVDAVDTLPNGEVVHAGGQGVTVGRPVISWQAHTAASRSRVFLTRGNESRVEVRDSAWALTNIIRWDEGDRTVTAALLGATRDAELVGVTEADARARIEQWYAGTPASDRVPAVDELMVDARGGVWVKRYTRPSDKKSAWWAFEPDGRFLCTLMLPREFEPREFGADYILGVTTAGAGYEMVQVFRLAPPS